MIFLTGATGLVGSFLIKKLVEEGYVVRALVREDSDTSLVEDVRDQVEWVEGELLDQLALVEYTRDVDAIFHCAALVSFDKQDKMTMDEVNIQGTAQLVDAAIENGVKSFVHLSSVAAIGRPSNSGILTEEVKWEESKLNSAYAVSKYKAEMEVWRGKEEGLKVLIVNPSLILGPADWNKTSTRVFKLAYEENKFYTGGLLNYIDIRDLVESIYQLYQQEKFGSRYIVSAGSTTYKDLFTKIALGFNKRPPAIKANYWLLKTMILIERIRTYLTGKKPMITPEVGRLSRTNVQYDSSKLKSELGFEFRSLDETLRWTCEELLRANNGIDYVEN